MEIRDATVAHLEGITTIYNDAVRRTTAIWNDHPVDREDRATWLARRHQEGFPVLVCVEDAVEDAVENAVEDADRSDPPDAVLGYATYGAFRPHDGFRGTVEDSVYVRDDQQGRGIGRSLLEALIARAREQDVQAMIAAIEAGNAGSVRLHEKLGFEHRGTLPRVGTKFGRRLDLALLQLELQDQPSAAVSPEGSAGNGHSSPV
ncbi:GNAT family N-acetyltransferase [Brachybacterium sp. AOP3-A1-3]|uniref:GNAT family N-acetyltransferase n=1 Tax=Brachybacterium sp. AOP3-A1-3 TaxID=3457699 RepID=UPI0040331762